MKRVLIAGIGGVGGYFGGCLAKHYENSSSVEVCFLARGEHLRQIHKDGLRVSHGEKFFTTKPSIVTDNASEISAVDCIVLCTKSFDLKATVNQLKPCIHDETMILPLANGVDTRELIQPELPNHTILDGCAYIVARIQAPGWVQNYGKVQSLYYGIDGLQDDRLTQLRRILDGVEGIDSHFSSPISNEIWKKYLFISPVATATCFYECNYGELLSNPDARLTLLGLIEEIKQLAIYKQIPIDENCAEVALNRISGFSPDQTSSMRTDFQNKRTQTELETLTGYVVREGEKLGLKMPLYRNIYNSLRREI